MYILICTCVDIPIQCTVIFKTNVIDADIFWNMSNWMGVRDIFHPRLFILYIYGGYLSGSTLRSSKLDNFSIEPIIVTWVSTMCSNPHIGLCTLYETSGMIFWYVCFCIYVAYFEIPPAWFVLRYIEKGWERYLFFRYTGLLRGHLIGA